MRKLEIVHKEVGGCLIACTLQIACVRRLEVSDQMCAHCRVDRFEFIMVTQSVSLLDM